MPTTTWDSQVATWDSLIYTWGSLNPPAPKPPQIKVCVWERVSPAVWAWRGEIRTSTALSLEARHLGVGTWNLAGPSDSQSTRITQTCLLTFDLERDGTTRRLLTGRPLTITPGMDETGATTVEASGVGILEAFEGTLIFPTAPTQDTPPPLDGAKQKDAYWDAAGHAETVLRSVVVMNWTTRLGMPLTIEPSRGRGGVVHLHERFSSLLTTLLAKLERGGLGARMGLVETTSPTRAELKLDFYVPQDRSQRVRLSSKVGSLRSWKQVNNAPTVTRAIVGGGGKGSDRIFLEKRASASEAAWGGWPREAFIDSRGTSKIDELDESGQQALDEGAAQSAFELEAVEAEGVRFGQHFDLGDTVTIELMTGLETTDTLRAVQVEAGAGINIKLIPGLADAADVTARQAAFIRKLRDAIRQLQREEG